MSNLSKNFVKYAARVFDHVFEHYTIGANYEDLVRAAVKAHGRKIVATGSGAYRQAMIFRDGVIKFSYTGNADRLVKETDFIKQMKRNRKFAKHFADTEVFSREKRIGKRKVLVAIQVQARVENIGNYRLTGKWGNYVYDLGDHLGIDDVHSYNYGWAGARGKEYPVFVDVDLRMKARKSVKRPAWAV